MAIRSGCPRFRLPDCRRCGEKLICESLSSAKCTPDDLATILKRVSPFKELANKAATFRQARYRALEELNPPAGKPVRYTWDPPETAPKGGSMFLAMIQRVECGWRLFLCTTRWQKKPRRFCGLEPNYRLIAQGRLIQPALLPATEEPARAAAGGHNRDQANTDGAETVGRGEARLKIHGDADEVGRGSFVVHGFRITREHGHTRFFNRHAGSRCCRHRADAPKCSVPCHWRCALSITCGKY